MFETYRVFHIARDEDGAADVLMSARPFPTLPAGWSLVDWLSGNWRRSFFRLHRITNGL